MRTVFGYLLMLLCAAPDAAPTSSPGLSSSLDRRIAVGPVVLEEEFRGDLSAFGFELEKGGDVRVRDQAMDIDVPGGCTVWLKRSLHGPTMIEYEATAIQNGGANDRVSDLNCFWMARDSRSPDDLFATKRSGKFSDCNPLKCYYVGLGGNSNTTTRFRRYIGDAATRPLLPENDLRAAEDLIVANKPQIIRLVACGSLIQFYRDDRKMFEINDADPYTSGWFGLRTTQNHMTIRHLKIYQLKPN